MSTTTLNGLCLNLSNSPEKRDFSSRSSLSMRGLEQAERGGAMVQKCIDSSFREGQSIVMDFMSPSLKTAPPTVAGTDSDIQHALNRHGTLITSGASPARTNAELRSILGSNNARLRPGSTVLLPPGHSELDPDRTLLEQAKLRARVELDIALDTPICVQGGQLSGQLKVQIRKREKKESTLLLAGGKVRVVGFECIRNEAHRHTFYLSSSTLAQVTDKSYQLFDSVEDDEGFARAQEGIHCLPFLMHLPLEGPLGNAKGVIPTHSGVAVRYIVMFSLKAREAETGKRSIAHFYRDCEIWPRLNPSVILVPSPVPIQATTSKSLFMAGTGKVTLTAALHRLTWVAGQQCFVKIKVVNNSKKILKNLVLTLFRTTVVFKPRPQLDLDDKHDIDPDACLTSTSQKQVAESSLDLCHTPGRGFASAKGWWCGIQPGQSLEFGHFILLPPDALSVPRSRLVEVEYSLRVSLNAGALTSDVQVILPIRIVNFLSLDPPPTLSSFLSESDSQLSTRLDAPSRRNSQVLLEILASSSSATEVDADINQTRTVSNSAASLTFSDDTDELVQHAVTAALIDTKYAQSATRFADLYYASLPKDAPTESEAVSPVDEVSQVEEENIQEADDTSSEPSRTRPPRPRSHSSFAQRVQEKLQEAFPEKSTPDTEPPSTQEALDAESPITQGSYFRPREDMPHEVEVENPPSSPSSEIESSSTSAISKLSLGRTASDDSQSSAASEADITLAYDQLPSPHSQLRSQTFLYSQVSDSPTLTKTGLVLSKLGLSRTDDNQSSASSEVDITLAYDQLPSVETQLPSQPLLSSKVSDSPRTSPRSRLRSQTLLYGKISDSPPPSKTRPLSMSLSTTGDVMSRPPLVADTGRSTSSVKDRIKAFEERVQAERQSGPL